MGRITRLRIFDKKWLAQKHKLVTTETLSKAIVPGLPFENVDGSALRINKDYSGKKKRHKKSFSCSPFELKTLGKQKIKAVVKNKNIAQEYLTVNKLLDRIFISAGSRLIKYKTIIR